MALCAVAAVDARHQAQRGRPRPDQRPFRDARRMVRRRRALEPLQRAAPAARSTTQSVPDANEEYLLYQTLVGAWPLGAVQRPRNTPSSWSASRTTCSRPCTRPRSIRAGSTPTPTTTRPSSEFVGRILDERAEPAVPRRLPGVPAAGQPSTACSTRCRRRCSSSPRPACRTPTRGPSSGTSAWWTRTTAGRWTTTAGAGCSGSSSRPSSPPAATCGTWPGTWSPPRRTAGSSSTSPTGRCLPPRPPRALHRRRIPPPGRRGLEGRAPVRLRPARRRCRRRRRGAAPGGRPGPRPRPPAARRRGLAGHPADPDRPRPGPPLAQPLHRRGPDARGPRRPALPGRGRRLRQLPRRPARRRARSLDPIARSQHARSLVVLFPRKFPRNYFPVAFIDKTYGEKSAVFPIGAVNEIAKSRHYVGRGNVGIGGLNIHQSTLPCTSDSPLRPALPTWRPGGVTEIRESKRCRTESFRRAAA